MPSRREQAASDSGYVPARQRSAEGGIRARSQKGAFAQTWWARAWENALLGFMDPARLSRGRTYARHGQVVDLDIQAGLIAARIQGSRPRPYRVTVTIPTLSDAAWERAIEAISQQAMYAAQLLNGEMPGEIAQLFADLGLELFPSSASDVHMTCTCPDWEVPCKHLAAVLLLVGERLDQDPFLLFAMRGRTQEQVVRALRALRASRVEGSPAVPLEPEAGPKRDSGGRMPEPSDGESEAELVARFWQLGGELKSLQVRVGPPEVELQVLKVLGEPEFVEERNLTQRLAEVYAAVTERAVELAFGERAKEPSA